FRDGHLFFSGQRQAVNAGLSVSRVCGAAQIKAMKKVSSGIKLELAQYRELLAFAQFGSELDKDTADKLNHGQRIMEILKQAQYKPLKVEEEVMILFAVTNRYLDDIPVDRVKAFENDFLEYMENTSSETAKKILEKKELTDEIKEELKLKIEEFKKTFN
ncbi:MAG: F0F1 ATP synthase subunit alpha, partial [Fenollaria timonensis]